MLIRSFLPSDLDQVVDLTIETFGPFYTDVFRPLVGDVVFANQHGDWADAYRTAVPGLHDPERHKHVAVAVEDDTVAGFAAWSIDPERRNGEISHVAVAGAHRRHRLGTTLCEHAFAAMRASGAEVAVIGTGGDPFHTGARALYESLGCVQLPVAVYYRDLGA